MGDIDPASQREVVEYYEDRALEVGTVGDYVRVVAGGTKTCFGPTADVESHGWKVVEIDWESREFLYAPIEDRSLDD